MQHESTLKMMMSFTSRLKRFFLTSVIAAIVAALLGFLSPLIIGFTVDAAIGGKDAPLPGLIMWVYDRLNISDTLSSSLAACAVMVFACAMLTAVFNYISRINMAKGSERMINNMRVALYTHTQNLPFEWHTKNQTGDIIQRCTSDVDTIRRFIFQQLLEVVRTVILATIAIIIMFSLNVAMATIVTVFMPLIVIYTIIFFKKIGHKFLAADEAEGELTVRVQENLTGVRVVRAFGREKYETERFDEKNEAFMRKWDKMGGTLGIYWGLGDTVSFIQILCVIVVGVYMAAATFGTENPFTVGNLLVFLSYTGMLMWPIRQMGRILAEMSKTGVSLKRIKEIFDAKGETDDPSAIEPPIDKDIEFSNVTFSFEEDHPILKDVSFTIKNKTTFGILGATGSGKSTITYLLNRLYDLPKNSGTIKIGGVNIEKIKKSYLRRNIGLVLQEPFLFSKTLLENIDIASRKGDLEKVREKAKIAEVDDNIMAFSKGYDTIIGERGVTLSGGQKQRVAIARTLMMNAPVMVFDDSMSALDMETDAKIRESLREDTSSATVILISHRISTLMKADTIMVLEDGKVAEIGSHAELVEKDGVYKRIYDLQSGYANDSDDADKAHTQKKERGTAS
ncbi:MAG: ABC transporter ATP-binding protein/permease [Oscillospiraceae bacterium]|nr:ABC transporter ATP-binding protein/permease [Oscillospiraceae bacterium]